MSSANTPNLRNIRNCLLFAHHQQLITDAEFLVLYDLNTSNNLDLPYWKYNHFDLDKLTDSECQAQFHFLKNDIYLLQDVLRIPDEITCYNRTKVDGIKGLCIFLKRFAYPCRYSDMIPHFSHSVQELCLVSNAVMNTIYTNHHHLLSSLVQPRLSPANLAKSFSNAVHEKGAPLNNCWGFIDGTVRPICRPGQNQQVLYNGHKRVHAIKFQSVVTPDWIIANLYGPVKGKQHDSGMLAESGLL